MRRLQSRSKRRPQPDSWISIVGQRMVDSLSSKRRSWNMSRIKDRDTKPELMVRSMLHALGFRFRLHDRGLPGRPDVVLKRHRTVIFVHGCFWHRHPRCRLAYVPKSNRAFWTEKFLANRKRDKRVRRAFIGLDWKVLTIWECEVANPEKLKERLVKEISPKCF